MTAFSPPRSAPRAGIVNASETENLDLFWAVRGAGGGNFGVHTAFNYNVVPTKDVTFFRLSWGSGGSAEFIDAVNRLQINGPREPGLRLNVPSQSRMPLSQPAPFQIDLIGLSWGPPADVEELLVPVEQIQVADARTVERRSSWAARDSLAASRPEGTYGIKTGFVRGPLAPEGIKTMLEWIGALPGVPSLAQQSTTVMYVWGAKSTTSLQMQTPSSTGTRTFSTNAR